MTTHPNLLFANDSLLLVVDMQSKLSSAMDPTESERGTANICRLIEAAGLLSVPVLITEQYPKGLGPTDSRITDLLSEDTLIFEKTGFSCCAADGFTDTLAGIDRRQIVLVGQETHVCVLQTALELLAMEYQVHTVEDAVCSRRPDHKSNALRRIRQQGATVTNYESVLFEWLKDAKHPEFKKISALVR